MAEYRGGGHRFLMNAYRGGGVIHFSLSGSREGGGS